MTAFLFHYFFSSLNVSVSTSLFTLCAGALCTSATFALNPWPGQSGTTVCFQCFLSPGWSCFTGCLLVLYLAMGQDMLGKGSTVSRLSTTRCKVMEQRRTFFRARYRNEPVFWVMSCFSVRPTSGRKGLTWDGPLPSAHLVSESN